MPNNSQNGRIKLSRRKILAGTGAIGAAGLGAGLGTTAFFSDQEQFANNQLTAGELDMKVSWEEHYSDWSEDEAEFAHMEDGELVIDDHEGFMNATLQEQFPDKETRKKLDEGTADPCEVLADVPDDLEKPVIDISDVKPGDFGEITFDFALCDNPGYLWLTGALRDASENGLTEPEREDPDEDQTRNETTGELELKEGEDPPAEVELLDALQVTVWHDNCDNRLDENDEDVVVKGSLRDVLSLLSSDTGLPLAGGLSAEEGGGTGRNCYTPAPDRHCLGVKWELPVDHANELQTDSVTFDLGFYTEQCRHNTGRGIGEEDGDSEEVIRAFLDEVEVPAGSVVRFGQVPPGTTIREPTPTLSGNPNSLEVPSTSGDYYMFYIDLLPSWGFVHQVKYAWLNIESGPDSGIMTTQAQWPPLLTHDDALLQHSFQPRGRIDGVDFREGGQPQRIRLQDSGENEDQDKDSPSEPDHCTDCYALIMDTGGPDDEMRESEENDDDPPPDDNDGVADVMAHEADQLAEWFDDDWHVKRVSQYWDNDHPAFGAEVDNFRDVDLGRRLRRLLFDYAGLFDECCQRRQNTDEDDDQSVIDVFVYVKAHGYSGGFNIYPPINHDDHAERAHNSDSIDYSSFFDALDGGDGGFAAPPEVPTDCVRFTVFIDACQSGSARSPFEQHLSEYREPTVLITSAEDGMDAYFDEGGSATAHFNGADDQDYDDDNEEGELGDRARHMQEEAGTDDQPQNPQVHSNEGANGVDELSEDEVAELELPECDDLDFADRQDGGQAN